MESVCEPELLTAMVDEKSEEGKIADDMMNKTEEDKQIVDDVTSEPKISTNQNESSSAIPDDDSIASPDTESDTTKSENHPDTKMEAESAKVVIRAMKPDEENDVRWLIYKRIFVAHAYGVAMDTIFTSQFICLVVAGVSVGYTMVGFVKALLMIGMGLPLAAIIFFRIAFLWKDLSRRGEDVMRGVYENWMEKPERALFVAKAGQSVISVVGIAQVAPSVVELSNLCTRKECVRYGVASTMLRHVLEICARSGVKKLVVKVADSNIPALKMFDKFGFQPIRQLTLSTWGVQWTDIVLELVISSSDVTEKQADDVISETPIEE